MYNAKKKKIIQRIILLFVALIVIGLIVFFISDVFIPFIKLEMKQDFDGAKELLLSKGFVGYLTVSLVEGLQMVVVFISAEFIQITSGMSYPFWLAIILCDVGVMIGSSLVYLLVNVFKFDDEILTKNKGISKYEKMAKTNSSVLIMYLLFIMPIIPFGAICYYGANKKIPYFRYLLTCATGVIPSIVTSIIMGSAIKEFISKSLPLWALVLIIVAAALVLFVILAFVLKKYFFKKGPGNQNPFIMTVLEKIAKFLSFLYISKTKVVGKEKLDDIQDPFVILVNHHSFVDLLALVKVFSGMNVIAVYNEYYSRLPILGKLIIKAGYIKKKMFYPDIKCVKEIMLALKNGYSVCIFPEARLSTDGGPSYFDDSTARLCKKMNVSIICVEVKNTYFSKPKWRNKIYRTQVEVEIKRVIMKDELDSYSNEELHEIIKENLSYNEFSNQNIKIKAKDKAKGLENILYYCPYCKSLYTNTTNGNTLTCTCCNKQFNILDNYQFDSDEIKNIYEYYGKIKEFELNNLENIDMKIPVDVKIFTDGVKDYRTEKGTIIFNNEILAFKSDVTDLYFEIPISTQEGLAYSAGEEFELYYKNELYYFYPVEDKRVCTKIALMFELLKEKENG